MKKNHFNDIVNVCSFLLYNSIIAQDVKEYLDNRLDIEIQKKFNFGFLPNQEHLSLLINNLDKNSLLENNFFYKINDNNVGLELLTCGLVNHNLILPYKDVYGDMIALVGRSLLTDEERKVVGISKYKNTPFKKSQHLFGLYEAKYSILNNNCVYVVEGQFDCIKAHSCGITNIVALGSSDMSLEQLILLLRYTNDIRLLLDNDEAGEHGRERIIEKFGKYTSFKNYFVPAGFKDLDEFLNKMPIQLSDLEKFHN